MGWWQRRVYCTAFFALITSMPVTVATITDTHAVLTHWCARDKRSRDNPPEATAPRARSAARALNIC